MPVHVQVMSGQLYAPGVPDTAELVEMRKLVDTYGKTWHTWQVDRGDTLPLGEPCSLPFCLSIINHLCGAYLCMQDDADVETVSLGGQTMWRDIVVQNV